MAACGDNRGRSVVAGGVGGAVVACERLCVYASPGNACVKDGRGGRVGAGVCAAGDEVGGGGVVVDLLNGLGMGEMDDQPLKYWEYAKAAGCVDACVPVRMCACMFAPALCMRECECGGACPRGLMRTWSWIRCMDSRMALCVQIVECVSAVAKMCCFYFNSVLLLSFQRA